MEDEHDKEEVAEPTRLSPDIDLHGEREVAPSLAGAGAVQRVADAERPEDIDPQDAGDALEYLLRSFHDGGEVTNTLTINVGSRTNPRKIRWVVRNLPGQLIRKIKEDAEERARRSKTSGAAAGFEANVRVVIEGTVEPDIKAGARQLGLADPADFLEPALNRKQGLIEQIAGVILGLSGYDDEDVNDQVEAKAVGN